MSWKGRPVNMLQVLAQEFSLNVGWLWVLVRDVGAVVLVLVLVFLGYWLVVRALGEAEKRKRVSSTVLFMARRILWWLTIVLAVLLGLQALGILENAWAAATAVFGLIAAGFIAVWSVISHVLCAILLIIVRPFEIGDTIEIPAEAGGIKGTLIDLNLFYATLRAEDGQLIQIPNNLFFQKPVKRRPGVAQVSLEDQLMKQEATEA